MGELVQSNDILIDTEALRSRLIGDGYLSFRRLLPEVPTLTSRFLPLSDNRFRDLFGLT